MLKNEGQVFELTQIQRDAGTFTEFLQLRYAYLKINYGLSFRDFARRAGFGSPNYLKLVMDGARNLAPESLPKFLHGLYVAPADQPIVVNLYVSSVRKRVNAAASSEAA